MTKPNMNYAELKDSYLFFRIAQKVKKYSEIHPDKKILRLEEPKSLQEYHK